MSRTARPPAARDDGPARFARFALPPNLLGYCGPHDGAALFEYGASGVVDGGLRSLARAFDGAWPYLELIAGAHGIADPLDGRVIDAYWLGGPLLDRVPLALAGRSLDDRFRRRAGPAWRAMAGSLTPGTRLSHGFHVMSVYPWVGLLRSGAVDQPLHVLDRCRIRWGRVVAGGADEVTVRTRLLTWDGARLGLGDPVTERARRGRDGVTLVDLGPGDDVALHWDWVCERLDRRRLAHLRGDTARQLAAVNRDLRASGPARLLT
ncbi:MAG TPA: DUF6390 family protein [Acidimicrobiales bacterium]|nr:DUF6390 family protein [Acidimicrobiales bacterium]